MDLCARIRVVPPEEFKNKSSLKATEIHHIFKAVIADTGPTNGKSRKSMPTLIEGVLIKVYNHGKEKII